MNLCCKPVPLWIVLCLIFFTSVIMYSINQHHYNHLSTIVPTELSLIQKYPLEPVVQNLESLSVSDLEEVYFNEISTNDHHFLCSKSVRVGRQDDGGWDICTDEKNVIKSPCFVYSFGVNNIWEFDDEMSTRYGCEVRAFDPSMKDKDFKRNDRLWFFQLGIGGENKVMPNGWKIKTFQTILQDDHNDHVDIDILKIDVEFMEWESFEHMIKTNVLRRVKQLLLETHTQEVFTVNKPTTAEFYRKFLSIWRALKEIGFRQWKNHYNPFGPFTSTHTNKKRTCCYEHYFVNVNYL